MESFLVYEFTCASCSSSYFGKTCRHLKTRIEAHIKKDNKSDIFKRLHSTATSFNSYNSLCFKIIDKADSKFDLKIKEALHINWRKPFHYSFCSPCSFLSLFVFFCCCFLQFSFIYCFHYLYANYQHLLLS